MRPRLLAAALIAATITAGTYLVGSLLPLRPDALSERTWGNAWGMIGLVTGILVAQRLSKGPSPGRAA